MSDCGLQACIKKLIYQSQHRGTREADLLLGPFARHVLPQASPSFLHDFESLLELPDPVLVAWILGQSTKNPAPENQALDQFKQFYDAQRSIH